MGKAKILFKNQQSMICQRGESLDDKDVADALLAEVILKRSSNTPFVTCDNGGGFDASQVVGITLPGKQEPARQPERDENP